MALRGCQYVFYENFLRGLSLQAAGLIFVVKKYNSEYNFCVEISSRNIKSGLLDTICGILYLEADEGKEIDESVKRRMRL